MPIIHQADITRASNALHETLMKRHYDYGDSLMIAGHLGALLDREHGDYQAKLHALDNIIVRIVEKLARAKQILRNISRDDDALRDSFLDIAGYGLMAKVLLDLDAPKPEED